MKCFTMRIIDCWQQCCDLKFDLNYLPDWNDLFLCEAVRLHSVYSLVSADAPIIKVHVCLCVWDCEEGGGKGNEGDSL